jgi:AraC-like DNA-binding protein
MFHHTTLHQPDTKTIPQHSQVIEMVTGGRGWVEVSENLLEVTPGALLWHIAGDRTICQCDLKNPYQCLVVQIDGLPSLSSRSEHLRPASRLSWWNDLEEVMRFSLEIVQLYISGNIPEPVLREYICSRLRFQSALYENSGMRDSLPAPLQMSLKFIEDHYADAITLHDIAHAAEWSVSHLHVRFREHLGESPHQYLTKRRMIAAKERLAASNDPIKQISHACGFTHVAAFCAAFKKYSRMTPVEYRLRQTRTLF